MTAIQPTRHDDRLSSWKAGAGAAGLAAIASLSESLHPRQPIQQVAITALAAGAAFGVGAGLNAVTNQVDEHVGQHPLQTRLAIAGVAGAGVLGTTLALRAGAGSALALQATRTGLGVLGGAALLGAGLIGEQRAADTIDGSLPGGAFTAHSALLGAAALGTAGLLLGRVRPSAVSEEAAEAYARTMTAGLPDTKVAFDEAGFEHMQQLRRTIRTISGGAGSLLPSSTLDKAGKLFLRDVTPRQEIDRVMGLAPGTAIDPVRIFGGLKQGATIDERVESIYQEALAKGAFDRGHIVLYAPTGSGYIYPQTIASTEHFTQGDVASIAVQWNDQPSMKSYDNEAYGTELFDKVLTRFADHIQGMPEADRPWLAMSGDSLGGKMMHNVFAGKGGGAEVERRGLDAMFSVGNSRNGRFRLETIGAEGQRFDSTGSVYEFDHPADLDKLSGEQRAGIRTFLLSHHNDPLGKVTPHLGFELPDFLTKRQYGTGVPRRMHWMPGLTMLQGTADMQNGANLRPGDFTRVGHDYRADMAPLMSRVLPVDVSAKQVASVQDAMVQLELARKFRPIEDAAA
jgi:uncharacterized membrane protein